MASEKEERDEYRRELKQLLGDTHTATKKIEKMMDEWEEERKARKERQASGERKENDDDDWP